ncbi:50S ribosomal protein L11 methyltransferase [Cyclobacterium xiamenense]|uniref:50S ribosomal protein L11 methyltransferase n=1 Tax=Cyclobacterium xiamenense TaxID=1297121 RepID=UPI0012B9F29D|nr:50S ribosomal protein L11 methyltransferase [Cyclobacterium xiamenense]
MEYLAFTISCAPEYTDILIAEMAGIGFDSFLETETGFEACILPDTLDAALWEALLLRYRVAAGLIVQESTLPKTNWNEAWEKNYDPIELQDKVYVRATFHPGRAADFDHEIIITPKMSFGTGHHATTYLMLEWLLELELAGKNVVDAGSGTGILAIMAKKRGAAEIVAFDIDEWSVENGNENFDLNGFSELRMQTGTIQSVKPTGTYDLILANINKNVLLEEMRTYAGKLSVGGSLLLSGFYEEDGDEIRAEAGKHGLHPAGQKTRSQWAALLFTKIR